MVSTAREHQSLVDPLPVSAAHPWRLVLAGVCMVAAGMVVTVETVAAPARRVPEVPLDTVVGARGVGPLVALARVVHVVLSPAVVPFVLLLACLVVSRRHRWAALTLGSVTIVGWGTVEIGKIVLSRPRRALLPVHPLLAAIGPDTFPSGHTVCAAAMVAGAVAASRMAGRSTRPAWILGVPFVMIVATSRMYVGLPLVADVVVSSLYVGAAVLCLVALASLLLGDRARESTVTPPMSVSRPTVRKAHRP